MHRSPIIVHVTETPCYGSQAYFSYALLVCRHSHRWLTSRRRSLSAVILLAGQNLIHVARLASFSTLAYLSYALLVWPDSSP